jgi:RNA polymerase sigma factor for flagellar operon FliA
MAARLADNVSREDLVSYGQFGLIDAIDKFDPTLGVKFETYATTRIQGAIVDELRALDWAPRSVRSKVRWVSRARTLLEQQLHRAPTAEEIAAELGWKTSEVYAVQADGVASHIDTIDGVADSEHSGHEEQLADFTSEDPVLSHMVDQARSHLAVAVANLPERERMVAFMYWRGGVCPRCWQDGCERCGGTGRVAGLTLGEIGTVLGISESWACQLYTSAAQLLRDELGFR